ncbi:Uncharacterized protein ABJ99_5256 [Pseudomonas syringae pv. cilantro]|uniref:Acyl-CoA dehydrogenase C-terminal domain-containing protein n=2 Tax=Pseudomonas syringae group TaxID=136849 RepID=A0A0N0X8N4_PSESX|nr:MULTISPECIES: acyl-CoA dehydrogenase [Pseudomonas syringae group]KPC23687.1 Uncharacterized protein ABJ99_5256 [Pseudomonas syringae pv. cilantro]KPW70656.1 Uncharacterized protein ALO76_04230 [Pseudomonas syringae pv. coriandricola]RMN10506.1 hypothetical protein ALQ65_01090 [Pseudomonas syringae pv. coriandricola]
MPHTAVTAQLAVATEDLGLARHGLQLILDDLRERGQPWPLSNLQRIVDDPYVISKIGDLQIRLDVAAALLERAQGLDGSPEQRLIASSEAVIASADALQAVGNVQYELTGQHLALPAQTGREPLRWHYQVIGNQRLNGVVPPQLQE